MTPIPVKFQLLKSGKKFHLAVSIKIAEQHRFTCRQHSGMPQLKLRQKRQPQHQQICPCQLLFSRQQRQRRKHLHLLLKSPSEKVRTESS